MAEPVRFGRYSLIKRIASGGMAEIYLAKQSGPGTFERSLVIKRMLPHLCEDPKFVQMFLDEAALAAQLNHPHIAQVIDFGQEEDSYFIALELVKGPDLRLLNQAVKKIQAQMPTEIAMKIVVHTLQALDFAHRAVGENGKPLNIVHRDVSPQNVLVSYDGVVKLVDFGIAKASTSGQNTEAGVVKGKFAYLSPEQVRAQKLDGRSDLYAAALVLFELLTGEQGLQGDGPAAIANAMDANVAPIADFRSDLPPELLEVMAQAFQKDRNDRQSTCLEFANQLDDLLAQWGVAVGQPEIAAYVRQLEVDVGEPLSAAARTGSFVAGAEMPPPGTGPGGRNRARVAAPAEPVEDAQEMGQDATIMPVRRTGTRGELSPSPARPRSTAQPAIEPVSRRATGLRRGIELPEEPAPAPRRRSGAAPAVEVGDVTLPPRTRTGARPAVRPPPEEEVEEEPVEEPNETTDEGFEDAVDGDDPEESVPTAFSQPRPKVKARPRADEGDEATPPPTRNTRSRPVAKQEDTEDEEDSPPPRRKDSNEKKSGVGGFLSFLIFVGVVGGGGYGVWYKTLGPGKPPEPPPPVVEIPRPPAPPPTNLLGDKGPAAPTGASGTADAKGSGAENAEDKKKVHHRSEAKADVPPDGQAGLVLDSEPPGDIFVDDQKVGTGSVKVPVAPGAHVVKVRVSKSKLTVERTIPLTFTAGEWSRESVKFQKGKVWIKAKPWADVTFGGKPLGTTPKDTEVFEGTYDVVFSFNGKTQTKSVTVKGGDEQEISAEFAPQ